MLTIIIFSLLAAGLVVWKEYDGEYTDLELMLVSVPLAGFMGAVVGGLIALALPMQFEAQTSTIKIETLADGQGMGGKFVISSAKFEGRMKYVFYYKDGDLFRMHQVDYDNAAIKYTNGTPTAEKIEYTPTKKLINWFALDWKPDPIYIFHIPEGSIRQGYNLDAN